MANDPTVTTSDPATDGLAHPAPATVWACISYRDASAGIEFLQRAFGFVVTLVVAGDDRRPVAHAELRWPEGGGIMTGSAVEDGATPFERLPTGVSSTYVVTASPDAVSERCLAAGATLVSDMEETEYGSRGFTVADPEGNLWSFGTYPGS